MTRTPPSSPGPLDGPLAGLADALIRRGAAVRRTVLLRRRLVAAVCAAGAVLVALQAAAPPPSPTVSVSVAARDLAPGEPLGARDVERRQVPAPLVPDGAAEVDELVGRTTAGPLRRGEVLTGERVLGPTLLAAHPGLVAVPVRIPDAGSVGLLRVGDRVDVAAADPRGAEPAYVVAPAAPVLALPSVDDGGGAGLGGRLVVLATPPATAQELAQAGVSRHLSLILSGQ
ncbi:MAG: SAF domain-containing protein [Nocardioides sp.]|nr:SAF domain-containing protein [Nocardioides sp.]